MKCGNCGSIIPDDLIICSVCKKPVVNKTAENDSVMCPFCGESNPTGIEICSWCGSTIPAQQKRANPPQEADNDRKYAHAEMRTEKPAPKKKKSKTRLNPKFVIALVLVLCVLAAAVFGIVKLVAGRSRVNTEESRIVSLYSKSDKTSSFVCGGAVTDTINAELIGKIENPDKTATAFTDANGTLYLVSQTGAEKVADNVLTYILSENGHGLAYTVNGELPEETTDITDDSEKTTEAADTESTSEAANPLLEKKSHTLYLFNAEDKSSTIIANNVSENSLAISPDGKTVAYTIGSVDAQSFEGYIYSNGIFNSIGKNSLVLAVSDDSAYIYYIKYDYNSDVPLVKLFAKSADNETKLDEFSDDIGIDIISNNTVSQIIYGKSETEDSKPGNYYFVDGCTDKKKLTTSYGGVFADGKTYWSCGRVYICPTDSFAGSVFRGPDTSVCYIESDFKVTVISPSSSKIFVSGDEKSLFYIDGNEYLFSCILGDIGTKKKIATHVSACGSSYSGDKLYYINGDGELHSYIKNTDCTVSTSVYNSGKELAVTPEGTVYFLENYSSGSGVLCFCKNGQDKQLIDGADNVHDIITDNGENIYFRADYSSASGSFALYYGSKQEFTKLFDEIG